MRPNLPPVELGFGAYIRRGTEVAVLSIGAIGNTVSEAIEALSEKGRRGKFAHFDMRWLKPIDDNILHQVGENFQKVITVEDGMTEGGLGSAVVEYMAEHNYTPTIVRLGIHDQFVEHGSTQELYHLLKLDKEGLCESLLQVLER